MNSHKDPLMSRSQRVGLIACEIFFREIAYFSARCGETLDVVFLPKGLHDLGGEKRRGVLQAEIDRMSEKDYSRIVLGYALCNNGTAGLWARKVPLVIPRAHDCITLFLGSREKYQKYFFENTGTYFHTTGWLERGSGEAQFFDSSLGPNMTLAGLIEKYGEENGRYLWETLDPLKNYHKIAYIALPIPGLPDLRDASRLAAQERGWQWEEVEGDAGLIERLLSGPYPEEDFLILEPGARSAVSHDERILTFSPLSEDDKKEFLTPPNYYA